MRSFKARQLPFFVVIIITVALVVTMSMKLTGGPPPVENIVTFIGGKGNLYCGVHENKEIKCDVVSDADNTQFVVEDLGDGTFAIKSMKTGQYCQDLGDKIVCHSNTVGAHEKFHWVDQGNFSFALTGPKSGTKRLYCADEINRVVCSRSKVGPWETFRIRTSQPLPENHSSANPGRDGSSYYTSSSSTSTSSPSPSSRATAPSTSSSSTTSTTSSSSSKSSSYHDNNKATSSKSFWQWLLSLFFN